MNTKKILISGLAVALSLGAVVPAFAKSMPATSRSTTTIAQDLNKVRKPRKMVNQDNKTVVGVASAISGESLTLTAKNTSYSVNLNSSSTTSILDRNRKPIEITNIQTGDNVRVFGVISGSNISASIVRDISLPVRTKPATKVKK